MNNDISVLWEDVISELLKDGMSELTYNTHFANLKVYFQDENTICLVAPTSFNVTFIRLRFYETIRNTIIHLTDKEYEIVLKDEKDNTDITTNDNNQKKEKLKFPQGLKEDFTFENYIVGNSNRFACDIAKNIVENPGGQFNPFYIYGGVGLGKTHLMQAIGHEIYKRNNEMNVVYASGEKFASDYIYLMTNQNRNNTAELEHIKNKYRDADILLIDDVQFLVGKEACQQQFFYTFNALFESGKQIVLTSEKPPKDINMEERLKTRFVMGMMVDIVAPDYETRLAILKNKVENGKYVIREEFLDEIATKVKTNIRELEGVFNKVVAYKTITKKELTIEIVNEMIETVLVKSASTITSNLIMQVVARFYNVKVDDLKGPKRSANVTIPRQIAMHLCRELANMSYQSIGKEFGGRDHSTALHSCEKIADEYNNNKETRELIEDIKKTLRV